MPFTEKDYSQFITAELSERLKANTNDDDDLKAANISGVSMSTINKVKNRKLPLTEYSATGIIALSQIAMLKAEQSEQTRKDDRRFFKKLLKNQTAKY